MNYELLPSSRLTAFGSSLVPGELTLGREETAANERWLRTWKAIHINSEFMIQNSASPTCKLETAYRQLTLPRRVAKMNKFSCIEETPLWTG